MSVPTGVWQLPLVAAVLLIIVFWLIVELRRRDGAQERNSEFIQGLVNEAATDREQAAEDRKDQLQAWEEQAGSWRSSFIEQSEAWREIAEQSAKAVEHFCETIKLLDRNEQLRYDATHSQLSRVEAKLQEDD